MFKFSDKTFMIKYVLSGFSHCSYVHMKDGVVNAQPNERSKSYIPKREYDECDKSFVWNFKHKLNSSKLA